MDDVVQAARELRTRIEALDNFWITVHESPDGDSIGSALTLLSVLRRLGKRVTAIRQNPFPSQYFKLPLASDMVDVDHLDKLDRPDVIIAVDVGSFHRIGAVLDHIRPETHVVNIDHHRGNEGPDKPCHLLNLVDPVVASTTMLTYLLLEEAYPGMVGPDEALCLYVGLITDTGCFRFSNTNSETLRVGSELARLGADPGRLAEEFMFRRRPEALRLLVEVLGSIEFQADGRLATLLLTQDMLRRTGAHMEETEGFVNYATSVDTVLAAGLFREATPQETRVSLRASGLLDVAAVASEFGGGGHANAAGLTIDADVTTARTRVTEAVLRHLAAGRVAGGQA